MAANINKGEVGFTGLDGKDYVLSFSTNALCALDEALGVENAFANVLQKGTATIKQHRKMFFIALTDRKRHPEITNESDASDLVIYEDMMELLSKVIQAQSPKAVAAAKAAESAASPPEPVQPQPSTGPAS